MPKQPIAIRTAMIYLLWLDQSTKVPAGTWVKTVAMLWADTTTLTSAGFRCRVAVR